MKINEYQPNKFSFAAKNVEQLVSATATPKFPSIDFKDNHFGGSDDKSNRPFRQSQEKQSGKAVSTKIQSEEKDKTRIELFRRQRKRVMRISDSLNPIDIFDTKSVELADNKSAKSVASLRDKIKISSRIKAKHNSSKSYRSAVSLLAKNHEQSSTKRDAKNCNIFNRLKSSDEFVPRSSLEKSSASARNREPIRITNNFFVHPIITREQLSQNFKLLSTFERNKMAVISDKGKGKSFKSLLNKTRPVLNLQRRLLTNDRIQTIAKRNENQECLQYL